MAVILFIIDIEEGHLLPSFSLAKDLSKSGHDIIYAGLVDNKKSVLNAGFQFYSIFEEIYPEGFKKEYQHIKRTSGLNKLMNDRFHFESVFAGAVADFLKTLKPDLFIISSFLPLEALIMYYSFHIKPLLFCTTFRNYPAATIVSECKEMIMNLSGERGLKLIEYVNQLGINFRSLDELVMPLSEMNEIVACPKEILMPGEGYAVKSIFSGPCIRDAATTGLPLKIVSSQKTIIYASLGSQAASYGEIAVDFFRMMGAIISKPEFAQYHFILATGNMDLGNLNIVRTADNCTIIEWASQIEILNHARLAITHGGLGTIKECIYFGVPMIVLPVGIDQPVNGDRVSYHKLGISISLQNITESVLCQHILSIIDDKEIALSIQSMQRVFREKEKQRSGIKFIEEYILDSMGTVPA